MDASHPSHEEWRELGFDNVISELLTEWLGKNCTKLQSRLIPTLLHKQSDVLLSGVTGSGKTAALVASMVQGIRNEDDGINYFVCANSFLCSQVASMVRTMTAPIGGNICHDIDSVQPHGWMMCCPYVDEAEKYATVLNKRLKSSQRVRLIITTPDVWNDISMKYHGILSIRALGNTRRVYVDDVGPQVDLPPAYATVRDLKHRDDNPTAIELFLGDLHQKLGPAARSVCQLVCVSADMETRLKNHLKALCMNEYNTQEMLSVARLPPTLRLKFCYHLKRPNHEVLVDLARRLTIPGRAIIFAANDDDLLSMRMKLRRLGMDVKLLPEIQHDPDNTPWKFLLLRESEGHGMNLSAVTHTFVLCMPKNRYSYMHMVGRTARMNRVGWAVSLWPSSSIRDTSEMMSELGVDVRKDVVDEHTFRPVDPEEIKLRTKPYEKWGLDPQYVVQQRYRELEDPEARLHKRLQWRGTPTLYTEEDYTPAWKQRRFKFYAKTAIKDLRRNPDGYTRLYRDGYVHSGMEPTKKMMQSLKVDNADRTRVGESENDHLAQSMGFRGPAQRSKRSSR
eukprot:PhM_4_TR15013/c0_g1_i1/m.58089